MFRYKGLPLISIIMPTYNRAHLIADTIKSIQQQTYTDWELIIIDDGSNDRTAEIVQAIKDDRILYFEMEHRGMENARSLGIEKANGEFIGFMDSDDIWATTKLEKQVTLFREHEEVDFCLTGGYEFKKPGEPLVFFYKQENGVRSGNLFIPFFKSEVVAIPQTLLFKKRCLDIIAFSKQFELAHIHFILNLARNFKGAIIYEALLYRRMHDTNYSSLHHIKRHNDGVQLIRYYKKQIPRRIFADALLKTHVNFGEKHLVREQRWHAIQQFLLAWKYQPFNIIPIKKIAKAIFIGSSS